jgi:hypothetical protein
MTEQIGAALLVLIALGWLARLVRQGCASLEANASLGANVSSGAWTGNPALEDQARPEFTARPTPGRAPGMLFWNGWRSRGQGRFPDEASAVESPGDGRHAWEAPHLREWLRRLRRELVWRKRVFSRAAGAPALRRLASLPLTPHHHLHRVERACGGASKTWLLVTHPGGVTILESGEGSDAGGRS